MKTAIVWFKKHLRLYDNEALVKNNAKAKKYCLYCFDDADFVTTRYGFKKGNYRAQFLLESLQDLDYNA
jgi:deoxyribodipyrimidine photo-lyase